MSNHVKGATGTKGGSGLALRRVLRYSCGVESFFQDCKRPELEKRLDRYTHAQVRYSDR